MTTELTKKEKKHLAKLEKEEIKRRAEEHEVEQKFNSDMDKTTDIASKNDIVNILKGKGAISTKNLKKILAVVSSRTVVQWGLMGLAALVFIMIVLGGTIVGGLLFTTSVNKGLPPYVAYLAYPQIFFSVGVAICGIIAASREIDVIVGGGATALVAFICFFILSVIVLNNSEGLVFGTCPAVNPNIGSALFQFAELYKSNNFTFNPIDPTNPDALPAYFLPAQFAHVIFYAVAEVMCNTSHYLMLFWWINLIGIIIAFIFIIGLALDLWNRHSMLTNIVSIISSKYNGHSKNGEPYIHISGIPAEEKV